MNSILWFPQKDNIYATQLECQIETLKAEHLKLQFEMKKLYQRQAALLYHIDLNELNLNNIRSLAQVVRMEEFIKIKIMLLGFIHEEIQVRNEMIPLELNIKFKLKMIEELQFQREAVRFKVLEFKKRG